VVNDGKEMNFQEEHIEKLSMGGQYFRLPDGQGLCFAHSQQVHIKLWR